MTDVRPRRSVLYMPGSNARVLEKAKTLAADALILDLEDAVAPGMKAQAREQVVAAVRAGGYGYRELVIRINALDTEYGEADLEAAAAAGPDAILVPKVSEAEDVFAVGRRLAALGAPAHTQIWAMIETPAALVDLAGIAAASEEDAGRRLDAFVIGTNDIAKETRTRLVPGRAPMLAYLSLAVAAARAHDLDIIDGVYNDLQDPDGFIAECRQGVELGMDGKTLIHPSQIEPCNAIFSPSVEEVARARAVIAAFELPENRNKGAIQLDGRMVERLHADIARRTVAVADAIAARQ